uniref:ATP-dependent (S)-NAD(P)H-hydrate dehydratase n=1 Tax=Clastoptera arizonana TaxID=38151 RepID=A0A1B6C4T5_9HEMI
MYTFFKIQRICRKSVFSILQNISYGTMVEELASINILKECKQIIPNLVPSKHKGQSGRIGIFGGSKDFTGAPFYSGMSSLRTGSDLIYIFCVPEAAIPIKSYSPELMVTPFFDVDLSDDLIQWSQNLHCAVIGPGLGRFPSTFKRISEILPYLKEKSIPLVFDADGVVFVSRNLSIVKNYSEQIYLTPNINEFRILCKAVFDESAIENNSTMVLGEMLSSDLGEHVTVLLKGQTDLIFNSGKLVFQNETIGSSRRCGGQGDILSGCLATFVFWAKQCVNGQVENPYILAGIAASTLTRVCNRLAFNEHGRGMIASDMIVKIPPTFKILFDDLN